MLSMKSIIDLIMQYHYVGLHKVSVYDNIAKGTEKANTNNTDDPLDDEKIAEGNEANHSMMLLENPEVLILVK